MKRKYNYVRRNIFDATLGVMAVAATLRNPRGEWAGRFYRECGEELLGLKAAAEDLLDELGKHGMAVAEAVAEEERRRREEACR